MYQVIIFFRNKVAKLAQTPIGKFISGRSKVRNCEIFKLVVEHPFLFHWIGLEENNK